MCLLVGSEKFDLMGILGEFWRYFVSKHPLFEILRFWKLDVIHRYRHIDSTDPNIWIVSTPEVDFQVEIEE